LEHRCDTCRASGYVLGLLGELLCMEAPVSLVVGFFRTSLPLSSNSLAVVFELSCSSLSSLLCTTSSLHVQNPVRWKGVALLSEGGRLRGWIREGHLRARIVCVLQEHFSLTPISFPCYFLHRRVLNFA
jgi:hypothetical protein